MDAVSYPNVAVNDFITAKLVPLRIPADREPLVSQFQVRWTPTLITLDSSGKEHHRTLGFLPPEELIPSLMLGMAKVEFNAERPDAALRQLESLLREYPQCAAAPEALYLRGVCRYKTTHDAAPLKEAHEELKAKYPGSEWVSRSKPYSLL